MKKKKKEKKFGKEDEGEKEVSEFQLKGEIRKEE
jgi:hypothetical protein